MMSQAEQHNSYSWQDYLSFPADERFELFDGLAYAMAPAPMRRHQRLLGEFHRQIANQLLDGPCEVYVAPFDVKLSPDESDDAPTVVEPDLTVVCDPGKLTDRGMTGPPDLVIEIVSPESGYHDRGRKYELYRRCGVSEYWIVDPIEHLVEVYRLTDERYDRTGVFGREDVLHSAAAPAVEVELAQVFRERES